MGVTVMVESKNVLHNGLQHLNIQSELSFSLRSDKHQNEDLKIIYHFFISHGTWEIWMLFSSSSLGYHQWIPRNQIRLSLLYIQHTNTLEESIEH